MRTQVRLAVGNGMRPDVWKQFAARFGVKKIGEFYGASEGNCTLVNTEGKEGAVGVVTGFMSLFYPLILAKYDVEKDELVRDAQGRVVPCARGEAGELLGKIINSDPTRAFDGYLNNDAASQRKIARNVKREGDAYFRTGDLLVQDSIGYYYFVDRIGDTFRWKGENVSTAEVEEALSSADGVAEVNVYGVTVPNCEGRCGMASIVLKHGAGAEATVKAVSELSASSLPAYARPAFVRFQPEFSTTGTFKKTKHSLVTEGFDPTKVKDPMFVIQGPGKIQRLDDHVHKSINDGTIRL
jgi:acyl-CoA synthetase (AMP-forming)/AMP-acid ligase II